MSKKIIKSVCIYTIFYIIETLLFALLLYKFRSSVQSSFEVCLFERIQGKENLNNGAKVAFFCFIQNVLEASALAVLTSYIFSYILNREPKIIFPEKLIIRHRTSWESRKKLTLGILIGNRSPFDIHNVVCTITCAYIVQIEPLLINSEITLNDERGLLENFYRFSFDLTKFPRQLLKDMLEKPEYYEQDTITVSITGNCNYIGNSFKITQKYKLSDITFDEHKPNLIAHTYKNIFTGNDLINPFTKKKIQKINWNEISKVVEVDEERRSDSVEEIRNIIKSMKKKRK